MSDLQELTEKIIKWGEDKGIYENSTYQHQLNKTLEEVTELHKAIIENDVDEVKDAIGDIYVTLVMASQFEEHIMDAIEFRYDEHNAGLSIDESLEELHYILECLAHLMNYYKKNSIEDNAISILICLKIITFNFNIHFIDCIEHAYNVISKRKGKMIDGQFVKDE
jgi:hypothetical protein